MLALLSVVARAADAPGPDGPGKALFEKNCSHCHNGSNPRAPERITLYYMYPGRIYRALTEGVMRPMAQHLSDAEKRQIVEFVSVRKFEGPAEPPELAQCQPRRNWFDYARHPLASGWGMRNLQNTRFIPAEVAKLSAGQVRSLKLKWAIALPDTDTARSQPAIAGGALFVGAQDGNVFAVDARSGCMRWHFRTDTRMDIRTAITIADWSGNQSRAKDQAPTVYFGDSRGVAYALNAVTGQLLWKTGFETLDRMTGSPVLHQSESGDRLYVPLATTQNEIAANPDLPCCTGRGAVAALDARTGRVIWKSYSIPTAPEVTSTNAKGVPRYGPSGASVWNTPTLDLKRQRLYVGTGENNSSPALNGGAVIAFDLRDGHIVWTYQNYPGEAYNQACYYLDVKGTNCPTQFKGRFGVDVSVSPLLLQVGGQEAIVVAQKPGDVFALDPDRDGALLWRRKITNGDVNFAGVFGMAAEGSTVFTSVFDVHDSPLKGPYWGIEELGLYALNGLTGEPVWSAPVASHCSQRACRGYSAALTAIPGVLFAGAKDGFLRAFDSGGGKLLWEFNTSQDFTSLNGEIAHGGDIDGPGAVVVDGMVYVNSGYATGNAAVKPGNAFLAFSIDGK
jgi:polyvinyl alcohol dehydrogenase (cytochrome)